METLTCFSFTCSASPEETQKLLKYSNKILLPPSMLHKINERDDVEFPLIFKVINPICDFGRVCAVHEFTSTEGLIIMPYYIMEELGIQEGSEINIDYVNPPKGSYLKIRPHKTAFTELHDPKTVLEHIMSKDYPVITQGETIVIDYRVIEMGSPTFLDVLSHETIHVAQSCFSGSRNKFPKRIGLPLEYSKDLNLNLSHNLYSNKPEEVMYLEREAFTYSKVEGVAIKLFNNFCG